MAYIEEWLANDNHKIVLIDIQYHDGTSLQELNVSSYPYVLRHSENARDIDNNIVQDVYYDDVIDSIPSLISKMDSSVSIGEIELLNLDGEYDYVFDAGLAFEGHKIKVYLGQDDWFKSEFLLVADAIVKSIDAPNINTIRIGIRDRKEVLDVKIQEQLIDLAYVNSIYTGTTLSTPGTIIIPDAILDTEAPICLGSCLNVEPKLIDAANHIYQIHDGSLTSISEVRANGNPLTITTQYTVDLSIGCIQLLVNDQGAQITCDVVGDDSRPATADTSQALTTNSAAWLIEWLIINKTELLVSDLCYTYLVAYANKSILGIYIKDTRSVLNVVTQIMSSVGGFLRFSKVTQGATCSIQIVRLEDPALNSPTIALTLYQDDIVKNGLNLMEVQQPYQSVTVGYAKNWQVQDKGSLAGIVAASLELVDTYTTEYRKSIGYNTSILTQYPLAEDQEMIETLITGEADADAEQLRRKTLRATKRFIYKIESIAGPFILNIGDVINVKHIRHGFTGTSYDKTAAVPIVDGKNCLVIGLEERPVDNRVDIEVWL